MVPSHCDPLMSVWRVVWIDSDKIVIIAHDDCAVERFGNLDV